jgi:hypothetical protein
MLIKQLSPFSLCLLFAGPLVSGTLSPTTIPAGTAGVAYSQVITPSGVGSPFNCYINGGYWPAYMSLINNGASCSIIATSPPAASAFTFTFMFFNGSAGTSAYQEYTLSFVAPLTITTTLLSSGTESTAYSASLAATGGTAPYTWSLASGSLPPGLSLSSGAITGTPTHSGTYSFQAKVRDSASNTSTQNLTLTIASTLAIATASLPGALAGTAYSTSLTPSGGDTPYSWTVLSGSFPPGLALSTAGTISGTPNAAGTYSFTVQVTDGGTGAATRALAITVGTALSITTSTLPAGLATTAYSQSLSATGGTPAYTWSLASGALPTGLSLSAAGTISGTPTVTGTYTFTVKATDSTSPTNQTATQALSIIIGSSVSVSTSSLPNASFNLGYSQSLSATGGTPGYTWSLISGALPAGLSLSGATITGTPTTIGNFSMTFQVADSAAKTATKALTLHVNSLPSVGVDSTETFWGGGGAHSPGTATAYYGSTPQVFGSAYPFTGYAAGPDASITAVQVLLDAVVIGAATYGTSRSDGCSAIGGPAWPGCPNAGFTYAFPASSYSLGAHTLSFRATDANGLIGTASFPITIVSQLAISTTSVPNTLVGSTYSQALTATGGTTAYTWTLAAGTLPTGLALSGATITGTPTAAGTFNFTVKVTDSTSPTTQTTTKALSIIVSTPLTVSTTSLPGALATAAYSQALTAAGGTPSYTWSLASGSLPAGLTLSSAGTISGTPTTGGTSTFTAQATDSTSPTAQTATKALTLIVTPSFSILTTTLPNAVAATPYTQTLVGNGGTAPYTWSVTSGTLPPGLAMSGAGSITGTPSSSGTYNFAVKGSDSTSPTAQSATQALSIVVGAPLSISTASLPNALATTAYSQPLTATGGTTPYTWSLASGALPAGLSFTPSGTIYGTPSTAGTYNFSVQVADSTAPTPQTLAKPLSLTVRAALTISTGSLPSGMVATAYSQTIAAIGGTTPYAWSLASGSLPAGLALSAAGAVSGTPTAAGLYSFVVQATDATAPSIQTAAQALSINILASVSITTTVLPNGLASTPYTQTLSAAGGTPGYAWSLASGSLPSGLTLSAAGTISGTPTAAGTYTFAAKATDTTSPTPLAATQSFTVTVGPALAITTSTLPDGIAGSSYAQILSATGGTSPYVWAVTTGALPAGLTLTPGGGLSGIPTANGTFTFTIRATDSTSPTAQTATQALTLHLADGLTVTTTALPTALATTPYSQTLAATGGTIPYAWSIASGALPAGLTLSSAGMITGTPTTAGNTAFVVKATDTTSPTAQAATQALSLMVASAISITTPSLAAGMVAKTYSQTVAATGGTAPYTWAVYSGSLPNGLTLSGNTISGTPTTAGTVTFTLQATDTTSPTPQTAASNLSITIGAAFSIVTSSPLPTGLGGNPYSVQIQADGGTPPYTFALASGAPPSGLSLQADGTLSGIPAVAGSSLFSVIATDSTLPTAQTQIKPLAITITAPLSISTTSLPRGTVSTSYAQSLLAAGGTTPYSWSVSSGSLPSGLTLSTDGALVGTPTAAGTFLFGAQVTDNSPTPQTATQVLSVTIGGQLTITTSSLPPAVFGTTYNTPLTATGGTAPYKWTLVSGTLPPGLSLSLSGYIVGTCLGSGVYTVTIQATDDTSPTAQTAVRVLTVDSNTSLSITSGELPQGRFGHSYDTSLTAAGGVPPYVWSIAAGALPTGLALSSDGVISGTPTTAGTATVSFRVTDSASSTTSRTFTLTVPAVLSVTTSTLSPATVGSGYATTLSATGGTTPYVWTVISGSLPSGITLSSAGLLSGSPNTGGTALFTVQVSDNTQPSNQTASQSLSIVVTSPLAITTTALPNAITGISYSQAMTATGGTAPYAWSLTSGTLPTGLTLASDGSISGMPTATGTSLFTLQATDAGTPKQSLAHSYTIVVVPPLTISTATLPAGLIAHGYTATLAATGGQAPYVWSLASGSLPDGLTISSAGTISGTPTTTGTATFSAQVTDNLTPGAQTTNRSFTISVSAPFAITTTTLPATIVGLPYTQALTATGGTAPYTWSLTAGQLPSGLTLAEDGTIDGTPTTTGNTSFTVHAADTTTPSQTATQVLTIVVTSPLTVATQSLPDGTLNTAYTASLSATGGTSPYTWTIATGSLPPGLAIDPAGTITGTPTTLGSFPFTLQVADTSTPTAQAATHAYTIAIIDPLVITTTTLSTTLVGATYAAALGALGGTVPYTWSLASGALPPGLSLAPDGAITGTPTIAGTFLFTAQAKDAAHPAQQATQPLTILVNAPLTITTTSLPNPQDGLLYSQVFTATGGTIPYTWSVLSGSLPPGLVLNSDGTLAGTPTVLGSFAFTVQVIDTTTPSTETATAYFVLRTTSTFQIATATFPNGIVAVPYVASLGATGGTIPYTWMLTGGTLPPGLNLSSAGSLAGTPTTAGTYTFTIQATDSAAPNRSSSGTFTVQIQSPLTITSTTLSDTTVGATYTAALTAAGGNTPYLWRLVSGSLPSGLTLTADGAINGFPAAPGSATFTIQVSDTTQPNAQTVSRTFTINVTLALSIANSVLSDGYIAAPYTVQFSAMGGLSPYTWSATGLPDGLTFNTSGYLSGTPTATGTFTINVAVHDTYTPVHTASRTLAITIRSGLAITTSDLPDGRVGLPYSQSLAALYGNQPYSWTIISGSLPPGISFTAEGLISGTPTVPGGYNFQMQLTDSSLPSLTTSRAFSITIQAGLHITTSSLPAGAPGTAYSATLNATGGTIPYTWSLATGTLPAGLILGSDGTITGTPATVGTYSLTVQVSDSSTPALTTTRLFSIAIGASLTISTATLADAKLGNSYRQSLVALNGSQPYYWTLQADLLPPGLLLLASGDLIGTPTAVGTYTFTVTVQDNTQPPATASQTFTVTVTPGFAIATQTLPTGTPGTPYRAALSATDGIIPYMWTVALGPLPSGIVLDATTGVLTGTPTTPGIYNLLIRADDASSPTQNTTAQFTLTIDSNLQITTATLPDALTGTPYQQALTATNGVPPLVWSLASALPHGLSLLPSGEIYGIPTVSGQYKITFAVSDASQPVAHASREIVLLVTRTLSITTDTVPTGLTAHPYATIIAAAGGTQPYRFTSSSTLPPGLVLTTLGTVTGTPTLAATYTVTIKVTDATATSQSAQLVFVIGSTLAIATTELPAAPSHTQYFALLKAVGGTGTYVWTAVAHPLPPGVVFLPSLAAFVGTGTTSGQYPVQISVTDGQQTVSVTLTIRITDPLTVSPIPLPTAQQSLPYSTTLAATGGVPPYTWTLSSSATLPAGLTLSTRGVLAGRPSGSPGAFPLPFCVTDSAKPQSTRACAVRTFIIGAAFQIVAATLRTTVPGQSMSYTLTTSGAQGSVTWTAAFPLPTGITLGADGTISGTPTTAGTYDLTIIASDAAHEFAVADFTFVVTPPLTIASTDLPAAVLGTPYAAGLIATSGHAPYTWSADPATLPAGFTLDPSGILYGSPSQHGSTVVAVTVQDTSTPPQTATTSLILAVDAPLTIDTSALPTATAGSSYTATLAATGVAPAQWTILSGQLPSGLALDPSGTITGTPLAAGSTTFIASVVDAHGQTAAAAITITVNPGLSLGTATSLPAGTVGEEYSYAFHSTFVGTVTWNLVLGTLPPGLALTSEGLLTGTPTSAATTSFMIGAGGGDQTAHQIYTITIGAPTFDSTPVPSIPSSTTQLATADVAQPYVASLTATAGTTPYAWAVTQGQLPAGLTLSSVGLISGTPTDSGTFAFALTVTDTNNQTASALFSLTVRAPLTITSPNNVITYLATPVTFLLTASGGTLPYSWSSASTLPPGLALASTGVLSGTPTTAGSTGVTVTVHDAATTPATVTVQLQIDVTGNLTITTATLPTATRNTPYSVALTAAGGSAPYTWSSTTGPLPTGLTLSASGTITGTATTPGTYTLTVAVTDAAARTAQYGYTLVIADVLTITVSTSIAATVGQSLTIPLTATGGVPPYTWSLASGSLPSGLSISAAGSITGKPTTAGPTSIRLAVRDAASTPANATAALQIDITVGLVISTTTLPTAPRNLPYNASLSATGGTLPYTWKLTDGQLPTGLTLSAAGSIAGTPTTIGVYRFAITLTDATDHTTIASYALTVGDPLIITSPTTLTLTVARATTLTLTATGGTQPYTWAITSGALPTGLTLSPAGSIAGTVPTPTNTTITISVHDAATTPATASQSLAITATTALLVSTTTLPTGYLTSPYSAALQVAGGTGPYTWAITSGSLAPGLALSAAGLLSGTPNIAGSYTFTVSVTDNTGQQANATLTCSIAALAIVTTSLPAGTAGSSYLATLDARGGLPPYSWSTSTPLPTGLQFTADGVITGTPSAPFSGSLTFTVTDQLNVTATANLPLTLDTPPARHLRISGLPAQLAPAAQLALVLTLDQAAPIDLTGRIAVTFAPDIAGRDDSTLTLVPANTRTLPFSIAKGSTIVHLQQSATLQAGTSAGLITLTATIDKSPSSTSTATLRIPALAPVITAAHIISHDAYTLTLELDGYSTTAEMTHARFAFSGLAAQPDFNIDVAALFNVWYASQPAFNQGGSFHYKQTFNFTGDTTRLSSVTATLTNSIGSTAVYFIAVTE